MRDLVLARRSSVGPQDCQLLVVELVHVQRACRVVLRQPGEVDDASTLGGHLERRLLRLLRRRGHADAICAGTAGALHDPADAVVVGGDPGVVDDVADDLGRDGQAFLAHVDDPDAARAAVAGHQGLPAADRAGTDDRDGVAQLNVEHLDTVQRAGEGVGGMMAESDGRSGGSFIRFFVAIGGTAA